METLKSVIYFSLFDHPITKQEIYTFCKMEDKRSIDEELSLLISKGIIIKEGEFYLFNQKKESIKKRQKGYQMYNDIMPKAIKRAGLIYNFPFVKAVGFSGSFSKEYFDDESDIDFFIITKHKRLWIARTCLILFKKVFLLNSKKFFCVNYFISENDLTIKEQNRFTATELITLKPVFGLKYFTKFFEQNNWAFKYFPNSSSPSMNLSNRSDKRLKLTVLFERLLSSEIGTKIDDYFRSITVKKWMSKFSDMEKEQFEIALKSTRNVSKHHPRNFQKRVVDLLNEKYTEVYKKYQLELEKEYA